MIKKQFLYFIPAILVTLIIFGLSSRDITVSNEQSGQVTERVMGLFGNIENSDIENGSLQTFNGVGLDIINLYIRSLAHVLEFGGLGLMIILGCLCCGFTQKHYIKLTLLWGLSTAFLDEGIQYFTPGRTADMLDISKDIIGILLAIAFAFAIHFIYERIRSKKDSLANSH